MGASRQRVVVVFLSTGFALAEAERLVEVFNFANRLQTTSSAYHLQFLSANGGPLRSSSGVQISTDALDDDHCRHVHAFFHLHGDYAPITWSDELFRRLRDVQARARLIVDGMRLVAIAGSKWALACNDTSAIGVSSLVPTLRDVMPSSAADEDTFEAALSLIKCDLGDGAAWEISRNMSRAGGEPFAKSTWALRELSASPSIRTSARQLRSECVNRISIADAAREAAMSERNFLRRFKKEIGVTPTEFVLNIRLERACHMLVHTSLPADKVARRAGLGSGERLAKLFRQRLSISPTEYRATERDRIARVGISLAYATPVAQPCRLTS